MRPGDVNRLLSSHSWHFALGMRSPSSSSNMRSPTWQQLAAGAEMLTRNQALPVHMVGFAHRGTMLLLDPARPWSNLSGGQSQAAQGQQRYGCRPSTQINARGATLQSWPRGLRCGLGRERICSPTLVLPHATICKLCTSTPRGLASSCSCSLHDRHSARRGGACQRAC